MALKIYHMYSCGPKINTKGIYFHPFLCYLSQPKRDEEEVWE
jgi:hypothetical protein